MLTFAFAAALLVATASVGAMVLFPRQLVAGLLAAGLIAFAEIVALSFVLSFAGWLTRSGMLVGLASVFLAACALWLQMRPSWWPIRNRLATVREALRDPLLAVLAGTVALALAYSLALGIGTPVNDWDSLAYHLPRAALWAQNGTIGYIPGAEDVRLNAFPPNAEIATLFTILTSKSDRFVTLPQFAALLAALVGVFGVSRRLGFDVPPALFGALLFVSLPVLLLQAGTPLADIVVAALLVAAAYFALGDTWQELAFAGLAVGLAAGTKFTTLLVLPVFAVAVMALLPARRWPKVALAVAAGLAAGSYWYVVNVVETGKLDGGSSAELGQSAPRSAGDIALRTYELSKDFLTLPGTLGRARYVYPAAGALLLLAGIAALLVRRRRRLAWLTASAGIVVALTPFVLERLGRLTPHVIEPLLRLIGRGDLIWQVHPPTVLGEANPYVSSYGAVGLIMLAVGAAIAISSARRGRLPRGAVVLAFAPALFLPLFAAEVRYDDLRSRFFAFTVALAAALWGLVLRRRALATTVVALTVVTACTTLAFATWKPSGLALLYDPENTWSVWTASRSRVVAAATVPAMENQVIEEFVQARVPQDASIGLALKPGEAVYPYFGSLSRTVSLIPYGAEPPAQVSWLVVSPARAAEVVPKLRTDWRVAIATPDGWRVVHRS